jgi:hypothetical protein
VVEIFVSVGTLARAKSTTGARATATAGRLPCMHVHTRMRKHARAHMHVHGCMVGSLVVVLACW